MYGSDGPGGGSDGPGSGSGGPGGGSGVWSIADRKIKRYQLNVISHSPNQSVPKHDDEEIPKGHLNGSQGE